MGYFDADYRLVIYIQSIPTVAKFSSSGREDVDVRMLGKGRPFLFELVNSRKVNLTATDLETIQCDINLLTKDIFVRDLQLVKK